MIAAHADTARLAAELRARAERLAALHGQSMGQSMGQSTHPRTDEHRWRSAAALWPGFVKE